MATSKPTMRAVKSAPAPKKPVPTVRPTIKAATRRAAPAAPQPTIKATIGGSGRGQTIRRVPAKTIEQKLKDARPGDDKKAMSWLYALAGAKLKNANLPDRAFKDRSKGNVFIGGMFMYAYDPKWKDELPWYDTLPVIIPIELYDDGWLGLNVHYLPPLLRAKLMDKLGEFRRRAGTDRAYMKVSYQFLKGAAKHELFEPCIHRYLSSHVRSKIARIEDVYWDQVAMLPLQKFQKATAREVWRAGQSKYKRKK